MIVAFLMTAGVGAAIWWWMAADLSSSIRTVSGVALLGVIVGMIIAGRARARRYRSDWESHPSQVVSHDGHFGKRSETDDPETFFGGHW